MSDEAPLSARDSSLDDSPASVRSRGSALPQSPATAAVEAHLAHMERVLEQERERLNQANQEEDPGRQISILTETIPSPPDSRRRMRTALRRLREHNATIRSSSSADAAPPAPSVARRRRRPRPVLSEPPRRSDRVEMIRQHTEDAQEHLLELQEASERLAQVNEQLRNLMEQPLPRVPIAARSLRRRASEPLQDEALEQPRRKRRRRERNSDIGEFVRIEYGHEGQVVPGRLKMELVSSDGGTISPAFEPDLGPCQTGYGAENALKDDDSVYCTESSRCNMVLCHAGESTFHLERLVIKAPRHGFTDPVQEGLVFVSMQKDAAFDRTAQYQIYSFPASDFASHFSPAWSRSRPSSTHYPRSRARHNASRESSDSEEQGEASAQAASILRPPRTTAHDLAIAMESDGNDSTSSAGSSDSVETTRPTQTLAFEQDFEGLLPALEAPPLAQQRPRSLSDDAAGSPMFSSLNLLQPTAHFSMVAKSRHRRRGPQAEGEREENSSKMTIKFNPPVSGRYILLKMWNPRHGGNIDLQSITVHGFAGVRWFPAVEMR